MTPELGDQEPLYLIEHNKILDEIISTYASGTLPDRGLIDAIRYGRSIINESWTNPNLQETEIDLEYRKEEIIRWTIALDQSESGENSLLKREIRENAIAAKETGDDESYQMGIALENLASSIPD